MTSPLLPLLSVKSGMLCVRISVVAKSKADTVGKIHNSRLKISVKAPAIEGKANAAVILLMAHELGLAKSLISVESGRTNRKKTLLIKTIDSVFFYRYLNKKGIVRDGDD